MYTQEGNGEVIPPLVTIIVAFDKLWWVLCGWTFAFSFTVRPKFG